MCLPIRRHCLAVFSILAVLGCITVPARGAPPEAAFDILLRGGLVIDGTGKPGARADVGIREGRIAAIGALEASQGTIEIDADGLVVCPGFIDLHSHADRGILQYRSAENYIRQGVATLVCGNCGMSPTNVAEFFGKLRDGGTGPNIALLIGHGSVREKIVGSRNVAPDEAQMTAMKREIRKAMEDGAVGMSTSLRYGTGAFASAEEIAELAKELAPYGGFYATHMREEGSQILEAIEEALEIGRLSGTPVHISHHKIASASVFGLTRLTLERIEKARAAGVDVTLDQYPYGAGSSRLAVYVPQDSLSGGIEAFRERIADPEQHRKIAGQIEVLLLDKLYEPGQSPRNEADNIRALARLQIARAKQTPQFEGKNLTEVLQARGEAVTLPNGAELLIELVSQEVVGINHTLDAQPGGDVDRVMQYPLTSHASDGAVFKFGEGNPHPRSYGCFPRVLGHYVRERQLLSLEAAIRKMTWQPAQRLGWTDRGIVREGAWADLAVFDPKTISDKATFQKPHQYSVGVEHVIVGGELVLHKGQMTGSLPGRPVGLPAKKSP
ncbi:N-acyl-D-amino-acid deacylase family protein [Lignipirellula cremea]|uniref:D-aminoacylase n=1 Tax=Lignipirellula cremea TaxID=2528010 RepID=A0A518DW78_9BACT|nr:D-aminoacylase [Lignipirellula cremea]QDU96090.1 D-aminoacylase [Lignipirellula cremea]